MVLTLTPTLEPPPALPEPALLALPEPALLAPALLASSAMRSLAPATEGALPKDTTLPGMAPGASGGHLTHAEMEQAALPRGR